MFLYSFLAMTAYNVLKPITRSQFISSLGAENIPYVPLLAALAIGLIMQGYTRAAGLLPPKWVIPTAQGVMAGLLVAFWLAFQTGHWLAAVGFYLFGLIMGILLISQFWTLANEVYDARQAKRLFGFIGAGASLGGIAGSSILTFFVKRIGTNNLLIVSAVILLACAAIVVAVQGRVGRLSLASIASTGEEKGVGGSEALRMLRSSKHLQVIALVIAFGAMGAYLIEQQLNMAAEAFKGRSETDSLSQFLGTVQLYTSIAGFVIQMFLTSRIHRQLGIGFALLILPVSLGTTAAIMLANAVLWAPALARDPRHLAALHGGQDDSRDPLPAAVERSQTAREAVRRRDRRPARQGRGRAGRPGAHRAMGAQLGLAAGELREPRGLRAVDLHGHPRQARLHCRVPPAASSGVRSSRRLCACP